MKIEDFKEKKIEGYQNTWSAFAEQEYKGKRYFLLENDKYGDEAAYLFYDVAENRVIGETFIGFDELAECVDDIGIFMMPLPFFGIPKNNEI